MAALSKLKKGGQARIVLKGVQQNDTFVVPRGFKIVGAVAETMKTVATGLTYTMSIGNTAGVIPKLNIAPTVPTSSGNYVIDGINVALDHDGTEDTIEKVVNKIVATDFSEVATTSTQSWTVTKVGTGDASVAHFVGNHPKAITANTFAPTVLGISNTCVTASVVGSVSTDLVNAGGISHFAVDYPDQTAMATLNVVNPGSYNPPSHSPYVSLALSSYTDVLSGTVTVNGTTYTPTQTATDVTGQATGIRNAINATSRMTGVSAMLGAAGVVVIYNNKSADSQTSVTPPVVSYSLGGCTVSKTSVPLDKTYYVTIGGQCASDLAGYVNVYIGMEKLD